MIYITEGSIEPYERKDIKKSIIDLSQSILKFLKEYEYPSENVLVSIEERSVLFVNIIRVLNKLDEKDRVKAYYISKFIAACASGLFDAALNYLWNETILNLKVKIINFDLDYFYDCIINNPNERNEFNTADDLDNLQDWQLIQGCYDIGILSEIGLKHLHYIRDMRNFASAAHPNNTEITGLQLSSWLETCIREVLSKEPSDPSISTRQLLINIRSQTLSDDDIPPISEAILRLPSILANSMIKPLFGMYVDPKVGQPVKINIERIVKYVWDRVDEDTKNEIGLKYGVYSVNGDITRKNLARSFLEFVNGLIYLTEEQLTIELKEKIKNLLDAHYQYYNFYNEKPHAEILKTFIQQSEQIPDLVRFDYVKTLIICRLGNYYGIARNAISIYNDLIDKFKDRDIICFLRLLNDHEFKIEFYPHLMGKTYKYIATRLKEKTSNKLLLKALDTVLESSYSELISINLWNKIKDLLK